MSDGDARSFYDALADEYHLIFEDWERSIAWQAAALGPFLAELGAPAGGQVLDCACGIGTQTLGLAGLGFAVRGSDLSAGAVARLEREAAARGLALDLAVRDVRELDPEHDGLHDVVLAFDNSLAHMLADADLERAAAGMASCARPGGLVLASLRPYDTLAEERPASTHPRVSGAPGARRVTFQVWDWEPDGTAYRVALLVLDEAGGGWLTASSSMRLRAVRRDELLAAWEAAGLDRVRWVEPAESGYYQPIVVGSRPA